MVANGRCGIKILCLGNPFSILCHRISRKIVVLRGSADVEGSIEADRTRLAVDVPLARVVGAVAGRLQHFRQQSCPWRSCAVQATFFSRQRVATDRLCIETGQ